MRITQAVLRRHGYYRREYHYVDATAGPGQYDATYRRVDGSPLVFARRALALGLRYQAYLIEEKEENALKLSAHVARCNGSMHLFQGHYERIIPNLLGERDDKRLGIVYVDPTTGLPDIPTLRHVVEVRPRMEILLYLAATNVKRTGERLVDSIKAIGKDHWLIRKPARKDPHQWTFLLGSGAPLFDEKYGDIDLHPMESPEGQKVLEVLNWTREEQAARLQPALPFTVPTVSTCAIPGISQSEKRPLHEQEESASDAIQPK